MGQNPVKKCEVFDSQSNSWRKISPLNTGWSLINSGYKNVISLYYISILSEIYPGISIGSIAKVSDIAVIILFLVFKKPFYAFQSKEKSYKINLFHLF